MPTVGKSAQFCSMCYGVTLLQIFFCLLYSGEGYVLQHCHSCPCGKILDKLGAAHKKLRCYILDNHLLTAIFVDVFHNGGYV